MASPTARVLFDPATGDGIGIVFDHYEGGAVRWAFRAALRLYQKPETWRRLVENAVARDFSWESQAEHYVAIYRQLLIH